MRERRVGDEARRRGDRRRALRCRARGCRRGTAEGQGDGHAVRVGGWDHAGVAAGATGRREEDARRRGGCDPRRRASDGGERT